MNRATGPTELPDWLKAAVGMIDQHIDFLAEKNNWDRRNRLDAVATGPRTTPFPYMDSAMDHNEAA